MARRRPAVNPKHPRGLKICEELGEVTISIFPKRTWNSISVEVYAIGIWSFLAFQVARTAPPHQFLQNFLIAVVALIFLAVLTTLTAIRLVWRIWGEEEIALRNATLTTVRRIGILGWSRVFPLREVLDLHMDARAASRLLWAFNGLRIFSGTLAFSREGRRYRLADRLEQVEAKDLLKRFRQWLPAVNWSPVLGLR
jgi:hypothetical protein